MPLPYGAWIKRAARWLYVTTTNLSVTRKTLMPWTVVSLLIGGSIVWSTLCNCIFFAFFAGGRRLIYAHTGYMDIYVFIVLP